MATDFVLPVSGAQFRITMWCIRQVVFLFSMKGDSRFNLLSKPTFVVHTPSNYMRVDCTVLQSSDGLDWSIHLNSDLKFPTVTHPLLKDGVCFTTMGELDSSIAWVLIHLDERSKRHVL